MPVKHYGGKICACHMGAGQKKPEKSGGPAVLGAQPASPVSENVLRDDEKRAKTGPLLDAGVHRPVDVATDDHSPAVDHWGNRKGHAVRITVERPVAARDLDHLGFVHGAAEEIAPRPI